MARGTGHQRRSLRVIAAQVVAPLIPPALLRAIRREPIQRPWHSPRNLYKFLSPELAEALRAAGLGDPPARACSTSVRGVQLGLLRNGHLSWRVECRAFQGAEHGIVYQFPLLDRRVVEYALGLPARMFIRDGHRRYLFRLSLDGILPDAVRSLGSKADPAIIAQREIARPVMLELLLKRLQERRTTQAPPTFVDVDSIVQVLCGHDQE